MPKLNSERADRLLRERRQCAFAENRKCLGALAGKGYLAEGTFGVVDVSFNKARVSGRYLRICRDR